MRGKSAPADRPAAAVLAAAGIFLAGFLFRLRAMEGKVLWFDEFLTANLARHSWAGLLPAVRREAHPPLYFALLKLWSVPFGDGRLAMKMFSLLAGMIALVLLADAARIAWGRSAGLLTALLFAFATVQVDQATDAKPYGLLSMFLAILLWSLVRLAPPAGAGAPVFLLALLSAVGCASTHFYGGLAAIAVSLAALIAFRGGTSRRAFAVLAVSVLAVAIWLPPALGLPRGAADYIRDIWARVPRWAPLAVSLRVSLPGWLKPYPAMNGVILPDLAWREGAAALLLLLLFLEGSIRTWRDETDGTEAGGARRFLLLSGFALLPGFLAIETLANWLDRPIGLPGRFEVVTQAGLALLAAAALSHTRRVRGALLAAIGAVSLATAWTQWPPPGRLPARREEVIVKALEAQARPGETIEIVTLGLARPPFDYYADGDPRLRFLSFPASQDEHPGWRTGDEAVTRRAELEGEAERLAARLEGDLAKGIPVYVAAREDPRNSFLLSRLAKDHDLAPTRFADWFFRLEPSAVKVAASGAGLIGEPIFFSGVLSGRRRFP